MGGAPTTPIHFCWDGDWAGTLESVICLHCIGVPAPSPRPMFHVGQAALLCLVAMLSGTRGLRGCLSKERGEEVGRKFSSARLCPQTTDHSVTGPNSSARENGGWRQVDSRLEKKNFYLYLIYFTKVISDESKT